MPTPGPSQTLPDPSTPPQKEGVCSSILSIWIIIISATTFQQQRQQQQHSKMGPKKQRRGGKRKAGAFDALQLAIQAWVLHTGPIHLFWLSSRAPTLLSVSSLSCGWQLDAVPAVGGLRQSANYSTYAADQAANTNSPVAVSSIDCSWW